VPEGLSATEAGKTASEHAEHAAKHDGKNGESRHGRLIPIAEGVLLAVVTLVAAWTGYSAAKWGGRSSIELAKASSTRAQANRAFQDALTVRAQDAVNFGIWFNAYLTGNVLGQAIAEKRFRPGYDVAFRAWLATSPFSNQNAPQGPQSMPEYKPPGQAAATLLDAAASAHFTAGEKANQHSEDYIRVTVILASVLFIIAIGSHFPTSAVRIGLAAVGALLLILGAVAILQLPGPPP
jgi:hypothetical protein